MPIPRAVARFNRCVTNPLARLVAGWLPPFAVVIHRGRVSGHEHRTPVMAFGYGDGVAIALTYGAGADWVRNVLAADGCAVRRMGRLERMVHPRIVTGADGMRRVPAVVRMPLRILRASEFLQLSRSA
jgi:deazaflavin-dependent oxidoreductase (nitroreductase family)